MHTAAVIPSSLSALALALVAGVHLAGSGALNRALRSLDDSTYVRVKQALDAAFAPLMKPLLLGALALAAAAALVTAATGRAGASAVGVLALAAGVVVLVAVLRGHVPVNRRMASWDPAAPPADLREQRGEWERWFAVRSVASGVAAVAALTAALQAAAS